MADGITPAFDVFSQRRDTGTKQQVTERRRVDTYTDPNRYQMPPNRRLFVNARQQDMYVAPSTPTITRLAQSLAQVKPAIAKYFGDKEVDKNQEEIEQGRRDALARKAMNEGNPAYVDNEWYAYGANKQQSFMQGEDLGRQLELDSLDRDLSSTFDEWYESWWNKKVEEGLVPNNEFGAEFNKGYENSYFTAKNKDLNRLYTLELEKKVAISQEHINRILLENYSNDVDINNDWWQIVKNDVQDMSHWDNAQMDEFKFNAIVTLAETKLDSDLLNILYEPGGPNGEVPAMIDNPKWTDKIQAAMDKIVNDAAKKTAAEQKALEDRIKEIDKVNKEAKKVIKGELGTNELSGLFGNMSSVFGEDNTFADSSLGVHYGLVYDEHWSFFMNEFGGDFNKASEAAKEATLAEAKAAGDLDPDLVQLRKERAEQMYNADTKVMSLIYEPDGITPNEQGLDVTRQAYLLNAEKKDISTVIPFWHDLPPVHKKIILQTGKIEEAKEVIKNKERQAKANQSLTTHVENIKGK